MRHPGLPILALLLLLGCIGEPPPGWEPRVGMTRAEAAQAFGEPVTMATRPAGGWPEREDTLEQVGPFARRHEQEHGVTAQTCEVRRSTTNPMAFGTLHYFLYGPDDRLLEHHARFLD